MKVKLSGLMNPCRESFTFIEKVKLSGLMNPCRVAKNEPPKPPNMAPRANAVSLVLVGLMPSARQAISSSRSASHARPIGSLRMRSTKALVTSARIRIRKYRNTTRWNPE